MAGGYPTSKSQEQEARQKCREVAESAHGCSMGGLLSLGTVSCSAVGRARNFLTRNPNSQG